MLGCSLGDEGVRRCWECTGSHIAREAMDARGAKVPRGYLRGAGVLVDNERGLQVLIRDDILYIITVKYQCTVGIPTIP